MSSDSPVPQGTIEFIQFHRPTLESGVYEVGLTQRLSGHQKDDSTWSQQLSFVVAGERFAQLGSQEVAAVFPPVGSLGDHQNVLPHITLKRSTLPWERSADRDDSVNSQSLPWLVLLLLWDADFAKPEDRPQLKVVSLSELLQASGVKFPSVKLELGVQDPSDRVTVLDLKKKYLKPIVPSLKDLAYLAHVRQPKDASGVAKPDSERATVLCNRLPQAKGSSTAYLISVEGRYKSGSFDYQGAGDDDVIRLVCLKSWSFSCPDEPQSFTQILDSLNRTPGTLRCPDSGNAVADQYLAMGHVPLPHALRQGGKTVSFYRGPLSPGLPTDALPLPTRAADGLLRYDVHTGMLDVSYAAAWELGRMLTLQNKPVSVALYHWKRNSGLSSRQQQQQKGRATRLLRTRAVNDTMPAPVAAWFQSLSRLESLPFNYLVPDEALLPVESLRFFRLDPLWVDSLLHGAFSIGSVISGSARPLAANRNISGILLRSSVVSGWPDLLVDAYSTRHDDNDFHADATPLELLRMERLSPNVLLCLFDGLVKTVDIHLKPEAMHFGVDAATGEPPQFHKTLRDSEDGQETSGPPLPVDWNDLQRRVLNISQLATDIGDAQKYSGDQFTSAQFALEMIEGVQKVRFAGSLED